MSVTPPLVVVAVGLVARGDWAAGTAVVMSPPVVSEAEEG